jgi:hypothetical protein
LYIYAGGVLVDIISPCRGWICHEQLSKPFYERCRRAAMMNLHWLLGKDCGYEDWKWMVDRYNEGRGVSGIPGDTESMFQDRTEYEDALNSYYNNEIYQNY